MSDTNTSLISLLVFFPALATIVIAFLPKNNANLIRCVTLGVTIATLVMIIGAFILGPAPFNTDEAGLQYAFSHQWIPSFQIEYFMGMDGISFPLILLTGIVSVLAMGASWSITKYVKAYCVLYLLLLSGMLGVFLALDFFLFYVFWEVMLLPMYFLIGVWGGPRREYAAIKFFLYTLLGSVFMLIAILMLYFSSDLTTLNATQLADAHVLDSYIAAAASTGTELDAAGAHLQLIEEIGNGTRSAHTFNIMALTAMGQATDSCFSQDLQWWAFLLLFVGFAIKVPSIPVHTWLPDAHVEAPTPISMILAGVLLKMGGYGIIRICYPICPHGGYDLMWFVCGLGVASMVYGAFAALAQKDFKRMVAYSSVSHMGYVVLGLGVWSASAGNMYNSEYWNMGVKGAMFQMIAHGISSAGMFFMVGVIYDRVHHRELDKFGGLFGKMPVYTAFAIGLFFAGLGLPGLCGFIGEAFVVLSVWNFSPLLAIISAAVVILTAGYILWAIQRVYLGAEYKGPHEEAIVPSNLRENSIACILFVLAILFGVLPHHTVLKYMDATIDKQVGDLATWTEEVKDPMLAEAEKEAEAKDDAEAEEKPSEDVTGFLNGRGEPTITLPAPVNEDVPAAEDVSATTIGQSSIQLAKNVD